MRRQVGPPFSQSSCRQRPHGMSALPVAADAEDGDESAASRCMELDTMPHSAQSPTPYAAFSTLQPATTRPSSTSPATPTGKCE